MKPLSIKEQIKILRRVLWATSINDGMCTKIAKVACTLGYVIYPMEAIDLIPIFNHNTYIEFYSKVKEVQKRNNRVFWDNDTLFANLRRRWFIRHLIKELKKQL